MPTDTFNRMAQIVSEQLGVEEDILSENTTTINDLGADSLDEVELIMELEEEFNISIPDDTISKWEQDGNTLGKLDEIIKQALKNDGYA